MATVKQNLAHPECRNWLKAALALKFAKEGIEKFVEKEVTKVQLDILNTVWQVTGSPVGTTCQTCTTQNVTWRNLPCPVGICQKIRDEIKIHHRKHKPAYENTDAQKWSSIDNSWEMAKCFMPPGYRSMSPTSTDFSGLINVVINLSDFQNLIQDDLSKSNNNCIQARITRNTILHSSTLKITDADFILYIDILINLLSDKKTLATDQHAQGAISKLQQLKTETFTVSEDDKTKLLAEAQKAKQEIHEEGSQQRKRVRQEGQDAVKGIHKEGSQQTKQVQQEGQDAVKGIHEEGSQQTKQIQQEGQIAVKGIHEEGSQQTKQVHQEGQAAVKGIHEEGSQQTKQIQQEGQTAVKGIHEEGSQQTKQVREEGQKAIDEMKKTKEEMFDNEGQTEYTSKQAYSKDKQDLKRKLIEVYQRYMVNVPISPLMPDEDVCTIEDLYAEPTMEIVKQPQTKQEEKEMITSYHKIFHNNSRLCKKIYIIGDGGIGKSSLCQNIVDSWCKVHSKPENSTWSLSENRTQSLPENQQTMMSHSVSASLPEIQQTKMSHSVSASLPEIQQTKMSHSVSASLPENQQTMMSHSVSASLPENQQTKMSHSVSASLPENQQTKMSQSVSASLPENQQTTMSSASLPENQQTMMSHSGKEKQQTMFKFDFLFYIPLRQALAYYSVEEMIKKILLQGKHNKLICKVLEDDTLNNLIILDGLDEWKPPTGCQKFALVNERLPGQIITNNCSILTTSRPWKLDGIKASEIDRQIKVTGLNRETCKILTEKTVDILNKHHKAAKSPQEFNDVIEKRNLDPFRYIPVMLMQLICLWYDGKNIGDTKCQIYSSMIDLQFKMTENKLKDKQDFMKMKEKHTKSQLKLPECFNGQTNCSQFVDLLYYISKMAFEALLNTNRESSLVFDSRAVNSYGLSETQLDICLKVGILSKTKVIKGCTTQLTSYSFLHKSFQEFFAALYICMSGDDTDQHLKQMFSICDSLDVVLEMENVFVFTSGLIPHVAVRLSEHICIVCSGDSRVQQYRQNTEYEIWDDAVKCLENVQSVIVECARESSNTALRIDDIVLFLFGENQSELLANFNLTNIKTLNITYVDCNIQICLTPTLMEAEALQKVVFLTWPEILEYNPAVYDMFHHLVDKSNKTLKSVTLSGVKPPPQPFITMLESLQQLEAINLSHIDLPHDSYTRLMAFLSETTQLRQIKLLDVSCSEYHKHHLDLSQHTQLQSLRTFRSCIIYANVNTINLEKCELSGCAVSADILRNCPKLQHLRYNIFNDRNNIDTLITTIPSLIHLKCFELWNAMIGNNSLQLSSEMKNLENVKLFYSTMTREAFRKFVDSIPTTHKSVEVELYDCTISNTPTKKAEAAETAAARDYIRSSPRFDVIRVNKSYLTFIVKPDKEDH